MSQHNRRKKTNPRQMDYYTAANVRSKPEPIVIARKGVRAKCCTGGC